jgi:sugar phosphate isomerase/epimerase
VSPPGSDAAAPAPRRLSLDYLTVNGATPVEQIEAAAAAGFDSVGLRFLAPTDLVLGYEVVGDRSQIREIVAACWRTGIVPLDVEAFFLDPEPDMDRLLRATEAAAQVGAATLLAVSNDPDRPRAIDRFARLCDAAAEHGLDVALEFMRWCPVPTVEDAVAFVTAADRPNAGVCVDALHLSRSGGTAARLPRLPTAGTFVQLSDALARLPPPEAMLDEARHDRRYPGEGELPLDDLLDALPPDVPISVEVPHRATAGQTVLERAERAGAALGRYLERYEARTAASNRGVTPAGGPSPTARAPGGPP